MYKYESEIYVYDKIQVTIITSIQCSWVKRFFEDDFHDWKVIPLFLIGKHLGKNFKFHNNIDLSKDILSKFPSFYQNIFIKWINNYTAKPTLPSMILSEFICFNSNIKVGLSSSKKKKFICFNVSPSKMMKNAFYFILKAPFVLKIFKFLY